MEGDRQFEHWVVRTSQKSPFFPVIPLETSLTVKSITAGSSDHTRIPRLEKPRKKIKKERQLLGGAHILLSLMP
ncbi:hypothetical protein BIW11_05241 [Tropilaelaps mercedesae]|uniref:Uncharacterized protein n=1 Tax=Tropilaelaps mercedesae TaxID=418985 RepID=A0A1V9Y376_9ACAR|nr:hypothetical protein BIW11_05241 [Tropilaelaps mercedesae]